MRTAKTTLIALLTVLCALLPTTSSIAHPVWGTQIAFERVLPRSTDVFKVEIYGGEPTYITVLGDGDTDLDLVISDELGNVLASDLDATDRCFATINPSFRSTITIEVRNLGSVYNDYFLSVE